ncbi:MAG: acyltransferase domain-containing protein [Myxococcales bacterium]|nr:acyltransferase domain-containing protein [Myxococcales bacterium]
MSRSEGERDAGAIRRWLVDRLGAGADGEVTFHGLGLDSLGTTALFAELSAWLGRRVAPTLAWDHPTPARLAAFLAGGEVTATAPVAAAGAAGGAASDEPIAIVGLGCRLPGAGSPGALWAALCAGRDCTGPVPAGRWAAWQAASPSGVEPVAWGGFLDAVDGFDAGFFGISPREASQVDPQQRLMLELTWEAFEDAGVDPEGWRGAPVGVFTGLVWRDYADLQAAVGASHTAHTCVGHAGSIAANRVSYVFGFEGPSVVVDTACSSALVAVHLACESLRRGESRLAVAGGVQLNLSPRQASAVSAFGALAADGRCKTFSAAADGYGRGEGAGVVLLEPLSAALRAGRRVYGVIRGSAVNNDGASNGITAPNPAAQRRLLRAAYARAGVDPAAVHYVELHGTGTPLGDPLEAGALGAVLGRGRSGERALRVGSVKSNIGHLEAAAGVAGLIKLALAVFHRALPPSLHGEPANPEIDFAGWGLRLQQGLEAWPGDGVPVGGVSSFGFGGTNCHVVVTGVEGAPAVEVVAEGEGEGAAVEGAREASVVFVFAGAGTPAPALGLLLASEPAFRVMFERCDAVYRALAGWSLVEVALAGDGRLAEGRYQLPVNLAFGLAMAARWRAVGVEPSAVVGYSVGEWAAACVAGAITVEEALGIAHAYTEVQAAVAGRAAMGVVGLAADVMRARLADVDGVWVAAENGPRSAGIGGEPAAVEAVVGALAAEGVFARRVRIDFFAHVPPAAALGAALGARLAGLRGRPTTVPLWSTVRGAVVPGEALDGAYWGANLAEPVMFRAAVAGLRAGGAVVAGYERASDPWAGDRGGAAGDEGRSRLLGERGERADPRARCGVRGAAAGGRRAGGAGGAGGAGVVVGAR